MLQPAQLKDAALRYTTEIAEVRAFLVRGGVPVETPAALGDTVQRLAADAAFHRDLGSHVWMLMFAGAGIPEVLQVLAVAAAGEEHASTSTEDDAHALLGFVLAQRTAFGERVPHVIVPEGEETAAAVAPAAASVAPAAGSAATVATAESVAPPEIPDTAKEKADATSASPVSVVPPRVTLTGTPEPTGVPAVGGTEAGVTAAEQAPATPAEEPVPQRRAVEERPRNTAFIGRIVAVAVCLLGLLGGGFWMYRESHDVEPVWNTSVDDGAPIVTPLLPAPTSAKSARNGRGAARFDSFPSRTEQAFRKLFRSGSRTPDTASNATASVTDTPSLPAPASAGTSTPAPIVRMPSDAAGAGGRTATPLISSATAAGKGMATPVPSSVLASRLGSPSANQADAVDDRVAGTKGYPHLLRRTPSQPDGTLMASASPAPSVSGGNTRAMAVPKGTVHSTSLGISAGNLVYAPDPAYPAAAAVQRVSGQVTVQAVVDREGNVASARVVSGPPLLRDAAVNAVQQWHYKPFLNGGKPQTFTATAVMDFQLQ